MQQITLSVRLLWSWNHGYPPSRIRIPGGTNMSNNRLHLRIWSITKTQEAIVAVEVHNSIFCRKLAVFKQSYCYSQENGVRMRWLWREWISLQDHVPHLQHAPRGWDGNDMHSFGKSTVTMDPDESSMYEDVNHSSFIAIPLVNRMLRKTVAGCWHWS